MSKIFTLCLLWLAVTSQAFAQYSIVLKKVRQPLVNISAYKQIGIGDIVGPTGGRSQSSLNLADEITLRLSEKGQQEVLDRAALALMSNSKTTSADAVIGEGNVASLAKRMQAAILIVGRIQNETVYQELKSETTSDANCPRKYFYEATGDFTLQLRLLDVKTARLIKAEAIKVPMKGRTTGRCGDAGGKLDPNIIIQEAITETALRITQMLFPYEETMVQTFQTAFIGNPFKELKNAVAFYNNGDHAQCIQVVEKYVNDPSVKDKNKPMAYFNYGIALFADDQYAKAKEQFLKAYALAPTIPHYKQMAEQMDRESRGSGGGGMSAR